MHVGKVEGWIWTVKAHIDDIASVLATKRTVIIINEGLAWTTSNRKLAEIGVEAIETDQGAPFLPRGNQVRSTAEREPLHAPIVALLWWRLLLCHDCVQSIEDYRNGCRLPPSVQWLKVVRRSPYSSCASAA